VCLAIPGRIIEIVDDDLRLVLVDVAGVRRKVNVGLLDSDAVPASVGDWVLIHVGFALSHIDEEEAQSTLRQLLAMGESYEEELEALKASVID